MVVGNDNSAASKSFRIDVTFYESHASAGFTLFKGDDNEVVDIFPMQSNDEPGVVSIEFVNMEDVTYKFVLVSAAEEVTIPAKIVQLIAGEETTVWENTNTVSGMLSHQFSLS